MNHFSYHKPATLLEASIIAESYKNQVKYLAGGTDLLVRLKSDAIQPAAIIDLKSIEDLDNKVELHGPYLHIGALAILSDIEANPIIAEYFPALIEAVSSIGSVQIRNRATIGGNLCNASPAADSMPPLFIYGTEVTIVDGKDSRTIPIEDFVLGPGKTVLTEGEVLASLKIPIPQESQASRFDRMTRRRGVDLATINICCQVLESNKTVRFAVGAAAPVPFIVEDNSGVLFASTEDDQEKDQLIKTIMNAASPIDDVRASKEYRQEMLVVLAKRTLSTSLKRLNNQDKDKLN